MQLETVSTKLFVALLFWSVSIFLVWFVFYKRSKLKGHPKDFPTIFQALMLLLSYMALTEAIQWSINCVYSFSENLNTTLLITKIITSSTILILLVKKLNTKLQNFFLFSDISLRSYFYLIFLAIGVQWISYHLGFYARSYFSLPNLSPSGYLDVDPAVIVNYLIVSVIFEEIIFRGTLLNGFLKNYGPATSIIVTSLLFSIWHKNPSQLISTFSSGLVFAWVTYRFRSIVPAILIHFLVNGITIFIANSEAEYFGYTAEKLYLGSISLWFHLTILAVTIFAIWGLWSESKASSKKSIIPIVEP